MTLPGVTVEVVGQPSDPGVKRSPPFVTPARTDFPADALTLLPPASAGQPIQLQARIPTEVTDPRKTNGSKVPDAGRSTNATVQVTAGGRALGPVQRIRFVIERPRTR